MIATSSSVRPRVDFELTAPITPGASVLVLGADLLDLSRKVAQRLGTRGRIVALSFDPAVARRVRAWTPPGSIDFTVHAVDEDLQISRDDLDACVRAQAPTDLEGFRRLQASLLQLRQREPLVASESVDVIVTDALAGADSLGARLRLLKEFHRVLRRGGELVLADVAADEPVSGEVVRAAGDGLRAIEAEDQLLASIAAAGLYGGWLVERQAEPFRLAGRAELRRVLIRAWKGKEGVCMDHHESVLYRGPFSKVEDDDGHVYVRGQQMAVCRKTFEILSKEPYAAFFEHSSPLVPIAAEAAEPFPCNVTGLVREPEQLKRLAPPVTIAEAPAAAPAAASAPAAATKPAAPLKKIRIYVRGESTATAAIRSLAQSVAPRIAGMAEVEIVDLGAAGESAPIPAQLRLRLALGGDECLPAIAVDGVLAAAGGVPSAEDVDRLLAVGARIGAVPFGARATQEMRDAAGACCGPEGCC